MTEMTADIKWMWKNELYTTKSAPEELAYYERTAKDYEPEFRRNLKYCGPEVCMQSLLDCEQQFGFTVPRNCRVLDVGAGTGLSGEALRRASFNGQIDALEPSDNMFSHAQSKHIYSHRYTDLILPNKETSVPSCSYDLVISIAVFNTRSTTSDCLSEVIRMANHGGYLSIYFNKIHWEQGCFKDRLLELVAEKHVQILSLEYKPYYEGNVAVSFVLKKL